MFLLFQEREKRLAIDHRWCQHRSDDTGEYPGDGKPKPVSFPNPSDGFNRN